jgi:hypothetical protein
VNSAKNPRTSPSNAADMARTSPPLQNARPAPVTSTDRTLPSTETETFARGASLRPHEVERAVVRIDRSGERDDGNELRAGVLRAR